MPVTYGFYNSYNHDRLYSAEQVGAIFDGLIKDGIYAQYGHAFNVVPKEGMSVYVQSGRAWIAHTWTLHDSDDDFWLTLDPGDIQYPRKDAIVLRVNRTARENSILVKPGTPMSKANPDPPALTKTDTVIEYPLAYITVPQNATSISASNIDYRVGQDDCPFIVHLLSQTQTVTSYINQFTAAMESALEDWKTAVLAQIADEYMPDDPGDDLGYAAAITNLQQGLADEITEREQAINEISGDGGAIHEHDTSEDPHHNVIYPMQQVIGTLQDNAITNGSSRVSALEAYFKTEPKRFNKHYDNLNTPGMSIARYDIGPGTIAGGKPDRAKMGDYILVFSMTTNPVAKYNVQVAFGTKYTMAMRCDNGAATNGKTKWSEWKYYTFK